MTLNNHEYYAVVHFYRGTSLLSRVIRFFGGTRYEHVELTYEGKTLFAHPAYGVEVRDSPTRNPAVSLRIPLSRPPIMEVDNADYDFIGAMLSPLRIAFPNNSSFCSEIVAETLKNCDVYYGPTAVTPGRLLELLKEQHAL